MTESRADTASAEEIRAVAARSREAAAELAPLSRGVKDAALLAMADALVAATDDVLAANQRDVEAARADGTAETMIDRLALNPERVAAMADGLRAVAALPDPVGDVIRGYTVPNGLRIEQVRVPLGVVAIVYEARPNVTVDAAGLAIKSGNAALLRGSGSAYESNTVLVRVLDAAGEKAGLPRDSVQLVPGTDRSSVGHLLRARGLVDVIIPRGGAGLINYVVENSTVPVIETGVGNCHIYVDVSADLEMAERIVVNAKVSRPSVCNSAETVLVHRDLAESFLPRLVKALQDQGVTVHGDASLDGLAGVVEAGADWSQEHLSLDMRARVVHGRGRRDRAHPPLVLGSHGGDHHPRSGYVAAFRSPGRQRRGHGQRVDPFHRRGRVRVRRRDRHLDPEAARPRPDGTARVDQHQMDRHRRRPDPGVGRSGQ